MHARFELLHGEGLDDVIVGAERQAAHALALLAARREHDHRHVARLVARPQPPANFEAGDARQHPVENDEIRRSLRDAQFRFVASIHMLNHEALRFHVVDEEQGERQFVLHDEDARRPIAGVRLALNGAANFVHVLALAGRS